jgi:ABC-type antimicrobial peptide transport system permease subunit
LAPLPLPVRWAVVCGIVAGLLGAAVGLIVGLAVHPPTAWFAVIELGAPSALLGAAVGLASGGIVAIMTTRASRRSSPRPADPASDRESR